MLSKTLSFNKTLFRKNLTRFWPLWAAPSLIGALFPLAYMTNLLRYPNNQISALGLTSGYYEIVSYGLPIISLCYALLVAIAVWSYLFNARSVGLMHTLPIRRDGLFLTNCLSGMAMLLIPYVITGGLSILIFACFGVINPTGILVTVLCVIGESLFYFSTATLVAFITGNLFAMPVLYAILHFLAALMDVLVNAFATGFLFGVQGDYTGAVEFLSPTVYLMTHVRCDRIYEEVLQFRGGGDSYYHNELVDVALENGWVIAVYALVGVVILALAYELYRRRRSETAGDVVAVNWMKPVFRYGVAICGSIAGGLVLYAIFWENFQNGDYYDVLPLVIAMLLSGAISYIAASMLLAKSFRIFRDCWKGLGVTLLCAVAICGIMHFDLLGVETRVPAAEDIETLEFRAADNTYILNPEEHPELVDSIRAIHAAIAADAEYIIEMDENWTYGGENDFDRVSVRNYVRLDYILKNGTEVNRRYYVPVTQDRLRQSGTYDNLLTNLINSEAMKLRRLHLADDYTPNGANLWLEQSRESYDLNSREARLVLEAVGRDMAEGNWGNYDWFEKDSGNRYAMSLDMSFQRCLDNCNYDYDYININLRPEMTHTISCLRSLGLVTEKDLVTYAQMYPEQYADEVIMQEWLDKYGAYEGELTSFPDYGSAPVSVGVIGGTDGPTSVYVTTAAVER